MNKGEATRKHILDKAFELIYQNGYRATSIDKIIETTEVTKGSFYHHFKDKEQMGLAMIKEVVRPRLEKLLISPLRNTKDPLKAIYSTIKKNLMEDRDFDIRYGCPINNLIQEMSPIKNSFKLTLRQVIEHWKEVIAFELERGKLMGKVNKEVDSSSASEFIIVGYEGLRGTGKVYQNFGLYESYIKQLNIYLKTMQ